MALWSVTYKSPALGFEVREDIEAENRYMAILNTKMKHGAEVPILRAERKEDPIYDRPLPDPHGKRGTQIDIKAQESGGFNRTKIIAAGLLIPSKPKSEYDVNQLRMGTAVEAEHTKDIEVAEAIAAHHIEEIPDYYTRLARLEKEAKKSAELKDPGNRMRFL